MPRKDYRVVAGTLLELVQAVVITPIEQAAVGYGWGAPGPELAHMRELCRRCGLLCLADEKTKRPAFNKLKQFNQLLQNLATLLDYLQREVKTTALVDYVDLAGKIRGCFATRMINASLPKPQVLAEEEFESVGIGKEEWLKRRTDQLSALSVKPRSKAKAIANREWQQAAEHCEIPPLVRPRLADALWRYAQLEDESHSAQWEKVSVI